MRLFGGYFLNRQIMFFTLFFSILFLLMTSISKGEVIISNKGEIKITDWTYPYLDIYENKIVWSDLRNFDENTTHNTSRYEIYLFNTSTKKEKQITMNDGLQTGPVIYKNIITWDDHKDEYNIYYYDLKNDKEMKIESEEGYKGSTDVFEDKIVYSTSRDKYTIDNMDVFIYNISKKEKIQIISNESSQSAPNIFENYISFTDKRNGNADIYLYNLSSKEKIQITSNDSYQGSSQIYRNLIVWCDYRNGTYNRKFNSYSYEVYCHDILKNITLRIPVLLSSNGGDFDIYEDKIIYSDEGEIIVFNYTTKTKTFITRGNYPKIWGNHLAYFLGDTIQYCTFEIFDNESKPSEENFIKDNYSYFITSSIFIFSIIFTVYFKKLKNRKQKSKDNKNNIKSKKEV